MAVETEYYHTKEAVTAHLQSVGLTFDGYWQWILSEPEARIRIGETTDYSASSLRQYIREHNTL